MPSNSFIAVTSLLLAALMAPLASGASSNLSVYSIQTYTYLGPTIEAHVKVTPLPSECVTVVTATWTDPAGGAVTRNSIASGTRRRAEFPIYSDLYGTFVFTVDDINCGGQYKYNGNDSVQVTIDPPTDPAPAPPTDPAPAPAPACIAEGGRCTRNGDACCAGLSCKGKTCK